MIKLEHESAKEIEIAILNILSNHLDLKTYKVFFFGSRIQKNHLSRSDIDLGIDGPKPIPDEVFLQIQDEISQIPTLYKIDLVDFQTVSSRFRKEALKNIYLLNS